MAPRILICSASVGSGHGRAAQAIESAVALLRPDAFVRHVDTLTLTNPIFRRIYGRGYFDAIDFAPHFVRYVYDRLDRPKSGGFLGNASLSRAVTRLNLRRFIKLLTAERWDLVINTHFLPPEIVAWLRRTGQVSFPQATVTTDFDTHRIWVHHPCDHYFTATEEGRDNLASYGVPPDQITASGIPIDPVFSQPKSVGECRRLHGIVGEHTVVLQLSGGQGFGPAEQVHRAILNVTTPLEIVVVSGRNESLRQKIQAIPCPPCHRRIVLGFTNRMDELMGAADLIISKPGGLSSSEALARGAALMLIEPIPGQEERNSDYLLENGAAVKVNNLASLSYKLTRLVNDPQRLRSLREASSRISRPRAAFEIAQAALALIEGKQPPVQPPVPSRFSRLRMRLWRRSSPASATVG